jgi:hypothetical protein
MDSAGLKGRAASCEADDSCTLLICDSVEPCVMFAVQLAAALIRRQRLSFLENF